MCRLKNIDEFIADTTQFKTRVQRVLTRKKQHAHKNSIVAFKNTDHFERYVSGIIHEMEI
jgi:hypothetical protein